MKADIVVHDVAATGAFSPDASWVDGITWVGTFDGRDLLGPMGADDLDEMCSLGDTLGMPCEPCRYEGARACFAVEMDRLRAQEIDGLELVEVPDDCP